MNTPFKMKGWSPFTKKTKTKTYSTQADSPDEKQKLSVKMPKSHPVTPPTKEQVKKSQENQYFLSKLGYKVDRMKAENPQWLNESLGLY